MTVTIRVGVLVLAALSACVVGGAATASAAVYGGTLGPLGSPLGPDAFYVTADGAGALTGIGLTFNAGCFGGTNTPVTLAVSRVESAAAPGSPDTSGIFFTKRNDRGRFSGTVAHANPDGGRTTLDVVGRMSGRRASGTLRSRTFSSEGVLTCDPGARKWRAQRRPGRIFAGNLRGSGTVVVTRDGDDDLIFHTTLWTARCTGGLDVLVPNIVVSGEFGLRRGRFTRPVEDVLPGLGIAVEYTITGRVGSTRASGDFRGTIRASQNGEPTWTCSIPGTHWTAISG